MVLRSFRLLLVLLVLCVAVAPLCAAAQPLRQDGTVYVVKTGDNLTRIAARLGVSAAELARANGITNANFVYVGQRLSVPQAGRLKAPVSGAASVAKTTANSAPAAQPQSAQAPAAVAAAEPAPAQVPDQTAAQVVSADTSTAAKTHIVQRGETLTKLAARYGVSLQTIMAANQLRSANVIYAGQRLIIPGSNPAPKPIPNPNPAPNPAQNPAVNQVPNPLPNPAVNPASNQAPNPLPNPAPNPAVNQVPNALPNPAPYAAQNPAVSPAPNPLPNPAPNAAPDPALERWIDVNLSTQDLVAYEGQTPVFTTRISSGLPGTPTVVGTYKIYIKLAATTMKGPDYYLPNVPYTMFFYRDYGIHGTYWHNNFGHPMSHGCVNVSTPAAAWLFGWASVGTRVVTHY